MMIRRPPIRSLAALAALVAGAGTGAAASAQQPAAPAGPASDDGAPVAFATLDNGLALRVDVVSGLEHAALWWAIEGGSAHDPAEAAGLAQVLGQACAAALGGADDAALATSMVLEEFVVVGVTVPRSACGELFERVGALFAGGGASFADAELVRLRDRMLLRADDAGKVLPGPVLRGRALRLAGPELPAGAARSGTGDAADLEALDVARIRAALAARLRSARASVAAVGPDAAFGDALREVLGGLESAGEAAPLSRVPAAGPLPEPFTPHPLVDAPFVVAAVPAPRWGDEGYLPFLIGMEAARVRAAQVLGTVRGGELRAEFPPLFWEPTAAARLACFERRGRDGDDVRRVRSELESMLAGLRAGGPNASEIRAAMGALLDRLRLVADADERTLAGLRSHPAILHSRARNALLYRLHGWPRDLRAALGEVRVPAVGRALRRFLDESRLIWVGLRPGGD